MLALDGMLKMFIKAPNNLGCGDMDERIKDPSIL